MCESKAWKALYRAAAVSSLAVAVSTHGVTFTWNKTTGGTWATAANWNPSGPPGATDAALFNLNASYTVTLNANHACGTLNIGTTSAGTVTFNGPIRTLSASAFRLAGGTVNFNSGTYTQTGIVGALDVSCNLNIGTGAFVNGNGSVSVGSSSAGFVLVNAATLTMGVLASDNQIGTNVASGVLQFDHGSVGTFANNTDVGQLNAATTGFLAVINNSTLAMRSLSIGVSAAGTANSQVLIDTGGSITQSGGASLTIGGATLNSGGTFGGSLVIANGAFTTGTGPIVVNRGGNISDSSVFNLNGDMNCGGQVFVAGFGNLNGSENTIQINDTSTANPSLTNLTVSGNASVGTLNVAANSGAVGIAAVPSGTATMGTTIVGGSGRGILAMGGVDGLNNATNGHITTSSLILGKDAGSTGSFTFLAGSLVAGSTTIGGAGTGVMSTIMFFGPGGTWAAVATFSGSVVIADGPTSNGSLILFPSNGQSIAVHAEGQQVTVGNAGHGLLDMFGTTTFNCGTLQIGSASTGVGTAFQDKLTGFLTPALPTITAAVVRLGMPGGGHGVYEMDAGTLNAGSMDITSNGTFIFNSGSFSGAIGVNGGTLLLAAPLTFPATINITPGSNILVGGVPFTQSGGVGFGLFAGVGTLNNGATLSSHGTLITGQTLINNATFSSSGGDFVVTSGATLSNGSTGLLRNSPASTFRIQTANFTNLGNLEVNAGGAMEMVSDLTIPTAHKLTMKGGLFTNGGQVTVANGGSLSGFGQIDANLINHGSATFAGSMLVVGNLTNDGVVTARDSTSIVYGSVNNTGSIVVQNGTIVFENSLGGPALAGGLDGAGSANLAADGRLVASYIRQTSLNISGTELDPAVATIRTQSAGGNLSRVGSLSIAGGKLDLADTSLIVDYTQSSPSSTIRNFLQTGFNGGDWQGLGLRSSIAAAIAADSGDIHKTALGFAEASTLGVGSFLGQSVDTTTVVVRYTFAGDSNLDGSVNTLDFTLLAGNFNSTGKGWVAGDYNYDGKVNALDFNALATNFGSSFSSPSLGAIVPEPSIILAGGAIVAPIRRRRRTAG